MVLLGETFPNFVADSQMGPINFHDWLDNSWGILFSHPNDFTPVCTTELARVLKLMPEFEKLGVKVIALSCNSVDSHRKWIEDIKAYAGMTDKEFPYPIIEDETRKLATLLGMLDPLEVDNNGIPMTARAVFIIDPAKKMRLSILYPATTGRNFDEILRVIESLQLTEKHKVATPVDWKIGEEVMIQPIVSDEEAKKLYNNIKFVSLPSGKSYVRIVSQPL
ncbi:peroxiredoxin-6 [Apis mellifera caucasica]|uniref:1-Cys peroxiredoxin n=1 Tax=Apis mellifera TaxID=7460 RepID=A0A7M7R5T2_APIME|nr:peroxiredoxin-6 [Apis mellifera]KAG6795756.1 peroxiredoxin-6 [Apis mellifera caucasica]KAG9430010.1 peroxiredoxin-6 [Apis mellifera carnica]|eukprot:XP_395319.2 peroxiredoxin-6 [Apis mellifera]